MRRPPAAIAFVNRLLARILPLSYVSAALFDFAVASTLLAAMLAYYRVPLTLNALYVVPLLVVLIAAATGTAFILSAANARLRDIGVAVPLLMQLWMFATPVIYPLSVVPAGLRPFYELNPMVGVIENFRQVLLRGEPPDFRSLGIATAISLVLLVPRTSTSSGWTRRWRTSFERRGAGPTFDASRRDTALRWHRRSAPPPCPARPRAPGWQEFWALRDVSFAVGAAKPSDHRPQRCRKSTILKLLSSIRAVERGNHRQRPLGRAHRGRGRSTRN